MTDTLLLPAPVANAALLSILILGVVACQSTRPPPEPVDLAMAMERLHRPLSGDPAALYRMRVSKSSGLRLALLVGGERGRMTVSEPFGSAVSLTAWTGSEPPTFFDLRHGCKLISVDLEEVLGVAALPLPQSVRLLVGRLPALESDRVTAHSDGRILVEGRGWGALVEVGDDPWRVLSVEEMGIRGIGWRIELDDHSLSVPGFVRVENADGRWAELDLTRLEWNDDAQLPALPDLPRCGARPTR